MQNLRHEDKCRFWDDKEFCDCGAAEIDRLQQEINFLKKAKETLEAQNKHYRKLLSRLTNEEYSRVLNLK